MVVGLSLSFCVRAIANGDVDEDDVSSIVTSCYVDSTHPFIDIVRGYRESYWIDNPECVRIAFRMYKRGDLYFPRVDGIEPPNIANGIWCDHAIHESYRDGYGKWEIANQRYIP